MSTVKAPVGGVDVSKFIEVTEPKHKSVIHVNVNCIAVVSRSDMFEGEAEGIGRTPTTLEFSKGSVIELNSGLRHYVQESVSDIITKIKASK